MNNLFVALFIKDKVCQYKIDEIIQNSTNGYINESLTFKSRNIYFPIQIRDGAYYLQNKSFDWTCKCENRDVLEERRLSHGDYFIFSKDDDSFSALITEQKNAILSNVAYELKSNTVFIGRSDEMNVMIDINANVSRKCAAIRADGGKAHCIEDLSGKTGVYLNGKRVTSQRLSAGDRIYIMGTTLVYFPEMLVIPASVKTSGLTALSEHEMLSPEDSVDVTPYIRAPRIIKSQENGRIVIDTPPAPQRSKELPFILTAGPSITMSLAMLASLGVTISNAINGGGFGSLITSGVMAISMLAGALLWPNLLRSYTRRQEEANEYYRRTKYSAYLSEKEQEIKYKYDRNTRVLNENLMPSPEMLSEFITERSRRLWERIPSDSDFLSVRLGIGELDFGVEIQAPNKSFALEDDPMIDSVVALRDKYKKMTNVPISLSLKDKRVVGVVGAVMDVFKVIVTNLISLHSPDEVKLVLVYNSSDMKYFQWANDLPHVWSSDRRQRYVATTKDEARMLFSELDEIISEREGERSDEEKIPAYVVLVVDDTLIEDTPFRRHLINPDNSLGVSAVFFGKRFNNVPKECVAIIQKDADVCGVYVKNENNNRFVNYKADEIDDELVSRISTEINKIPVKVESARASVPERVNFLDLYRVGNVDALEILNHWGTNSSDKSLAAPIGLKAGGEPFSIDIHEKYHGCHGLVAGTTGSGKSEFLQAYILSMMINYSPNEVAFVLVDFKGGDMARPFLKAPHLAATISNLSGNTLHRALISLEAEVKSRQNIFNKSAEKLGVDKIDINSYHKYFKDKKLDLPLPHLIIVIDEFAQLKSQHPEFMSKLIDIAQVGRSLGIHLILATQRPSGVVDPQIWSNSKFKVCLKVLDKQDSTDMINRPDAALIKNPGRAYIQVGYDEIFELVQSGYSGADYVAQDEYVDEESVSVSMVNWPAEKIRTAKKSVKEQKSEKTQLEEIVSKIATTGYSLGLRVKQLWLPPLPTQLLLEECRSGDLSFDASCWDKKLLGDVVCGKADLPEKQEQCPYSVNFLKNGHLAIYGSSGTGKSTLIQSLVFSMALEHSPKTFNTFVFDFDGNSLAPLASMPHCAGYVTDADERAVETMFGTIQGIISERREIFAKNHCANYESYISASGVKMPTIVMILDNYGAFREKMYRSEDALVQIVSAARSCGIYLVVTGNSKGAIYYKITEQISEKIVLNMNDSGAYRDILNVPIPIIPEQAKGRALALLNKKAVELQLAVPFNIENESARTAKIGEIYAEMSGASDRARYDAPATVDVPEEAYVPVYEPKMEELESIEPSNSALVIGKDLTSGEYKGFDLSKTQRVYIGTRGDKESAVALINGFAKKSDKRVCVITSGDTAVYDSSVEIILDVDSFIYEVFATEAETCGDTVIVIDGFCDFYDRISDEALSVFEKALARDTDVRIVTLDEMKRLTDYRDTGLYVRLVRTSEGAVVGGAIDDDVASAITTDVYEIPRKFREKQLKAGQATVYSGSKMAYVAIEG